ncbi:MAG: hypothetical protein FJ106_01645 [Deltaproteobacteria bacterium]|nr:hypothetical protein [Deltaproteobacteria bacterium]
MNSKTDGKFDGFPPEKQTWNFPTLMNGWVHELTGAEFKVLWYIVRHTFGWQKTGDRISYKQFQQGIRRQDGTWLDKGTGLGTRAIAYSLKKLEEMGFIERISGPKRGKIGFYKLKFADSTHAKMKDPPCKNERGTHAKRKDTISNIQSLTRQSLSQRSKHNEEAQTYSAESKERLLSGLKKIFPQNSFPQNLLLKEPEKVDYLLWKVGSGEIKPHLVKSPLAYIKSLAIDGPFPSFREREEARRKKKRETEEERMRVEMEIESIDWEGNKKKLKHLMDSL